MKQIERRNARGDRVATAGKLLVTHQNEEMDVTTL